MGLGSAVTHMKYTGIRARKVIKQINPGLPRPSPIAELEECLHMLPDHTQPLLPTPSALAFLLYHRLLSPHFYHL